MLVVLRILRLLMMWVVWLMMVVIILTMLAGRVLGLATRSYVVVVVRCRGPFSF